METGKDHKVAAEMEDVVGYLKRSVLGQTTSLTYFTREGEIKQEGNLKIKNSESSIGVRRGVVVTCHIIFTTIKSHNSTTLVVSKLGRKEENEYYCRTLK